VIDYDKLKLAHELARQYYLMTLKQISFSIAPLENHTEYTLSLNHEDIDAWSNIDELISKLQELTAELKPKYKVGQFVYYCCDNGDICNGIIKGIFKDINGKDIIELENPNARLFINSIYPSRESLIEEQIEYWKSLKDKTPREKFKDEIEKYNNECKECAPRFECPRCNKSWSSCQCKLECDHESDKKFYANIGGIMRSISNNRLVLNAKYELYAKCKKCGEFYK